MDDQELHAVRVRRMQKAIEFGKTYGMYGDTGPLADHMDTPPTAEELGEAFKDQFPGVKHMQVNFAEIETRVMAALHVDPDRREFCWLGAVLPGVEKPHVNGMISPLNGTGRVELYAITGVPGAWRAGFETHHGGVALANTAKLPPEIESMPYNGARDRAVTGWLNRLYSACYAEIFAAYPQVYPHVMREVCNDFGLDGYPPLWSDAFVEIIGHGTLGGLKVEGLLEDGFITVRKEWLV